MKTLRPISFAALVAAPLFLAAALASPASAAHRDRHHNRHPSRAARPFGYIQAADAAHGRAYHAPPQVHRRHQSAPPFAYIKKATDDRHRREVRGRLRQHDKSRH